MWKGTLEFYKNRISLGTAFTGLRDKVLYPIISTTSARVEMELTYSTVQTHSLVYLAMRQIRMTDYTKLPYGLKGHPCWWLFAKPKLVNISKQSEEDDEDSMPALHLFQVKVDEPEEEGLRILGNRMKRVFENSFQRRDDNSVSISYKRMRDSRR